MAGERISPDICIVGAGAAGLAVATASAALGVPTVLIERGAMGGQRLNSACVPSKALLAAASRAAHMNLGHNGPGHDLGVRATEVTVDFAKVQAHIQDVIASVAPEASLERLTGLGVRVIKGHAKFVDRRTVSVGDTDIHARRFVIATGSSPAIPPIPGLDDGPYLTTETVFTLTELPSHLVVIGAGPVGLEMAQAFRRLGSHVTVLDAGEALTQDEPECAAVVLAQLEREGVVIRTGVKILGVAHAIGHLAVTLEIDGKEEHVGGTHLLVAGARKPALDGLGLDAARIRYDAAGILVNRTLKTSNRRVYAIGDVAAGQPRSTHAATHQASLVVRNALLHLPARTDPTDIPHVTFTEPELAQTGLTEAQARARRIAIRILRWSYHDNDRAQSERMPHGQIKVIVDRRGRILGASIVGARAGELITAWSLAIAQRLPVRAFADLVVPYPTLSEIGKRAAMQYDPPGLTRPLLRRIIGHLRIFG
jgi:pyruvate/2-oxoglutarate dehydrogenase complex dihydrolipoamide dehydrogenase (E3) component